MYKKKDIIVYGQTGVCEIIDITEKTLINNDKKVYYVLRPIYQQNNVIYAPIDSQKVFMRPVMDKKDAENLILKIPDIKDSIKDIDITIQECKDYMTSHNPEQLVLLTAKIYKKKLAVVAQKKKLGFSDEKYMRMAENLLFGELALIFGIEPEQVPEYIKKQIRRMNV